MVPLSHCVGKERSCVDVRNGSKAVIGLFAEI